MATNKVNGIIHLQINKRLCEIVHRFIGFTYRDEDLTRTTAESLAHSFVVQVIFD